MKKVTCLEIEIAVAKYFNWRVNIIVPNISYGMHLHECDMLILSKSGYATEVEIKVSKADLKKDFAKSHNHSHELIKNLYYAVPYDLLQCALELVPETAGILVYHKGIGNEIYSYNICTEREPKPTHNFRQWTEKEKNKLMRLGCMRIFGLKQKLYKTTVIHQTESICAAGDASEFRL